jgi:G3E family GTPase
MIENLPKLKKVPVSIITGFLGSGKTTLINKIIKNCPELKFGLLINEFGEISVDESQLITAIDSEVLELASGGCICCTTNDDLVDIVFKILQRENPVDHLLIETTGLADPLPIAMTFLGSELRDLTHLDSIITILDAANFSPDLFNSEVAIGQITYGDIIILNKTDLVDQETLDKLEQSINDIKSGARILPCQYSHVALPLISDLGIPQIINFTKNTVNCDYCVISFQSDRPFLIKHFQSFLDDQMPNNVFRIKGILWFDESPEAHIFTVSGTRFMLDPTEWRDKPKNQLIFVGKDLDGEHLKFLLQNCLA